MDVLCETKNGEHRNRTTETRRYEPIIVLGTGRSGTSIIAKVLRELGVFMGYTFIPANGSNAQGHWEDIEFIMLGQVFLKKNCSEVEWYDELFPLIKRRYALEICWGFKCPSAVDLLAYYSVIFPKGIFIRCERDRKEVIKSVIQNYGFTTEMATNLYTKRMEMMDEYIPDAFVVKLEELRSSPEKEITRLINRCNVDHVSPEKFDKVVSLIGSD